MGPLPNPRSSGRKYRKIAPVWAVQMSRPFVVRTLEGVMRGRAKDYLCEGPAGERWPCRREIFEHTHRAMKRR